ncbi:hypothetical protein CRE_21863 [Caenorhabditis remanei]|uniref:Uncharacterized protein n=1 Tax=Caenorhabditis remanei TaxID=31234 RepID=E3MUC8_CAERE|nr:hypothetical protein CRE_21863 [Caenorhabditis remanei]
MSDNAAKCTQTISKNLLLLSVLLVESLVIIPSLVFTTLNVFASDENHYKSYHPELSEVVKFHFLLPIFVYQIIWLLSNIVSVVTVHCNTPYFFFFTLIVPCIGLLLSILILIPAIELLIERNFNVSGFYLGFVCGLSVFVVFAILFTITRCSTFRKMMKKQKVVQTTAEKSPDDPVEEAAAPEPIRIKDPDEISISFSRRSTMSMNDELYVPPPRR